MKTSLSILIFFSALQLFGQTEYAYETFDDTRIINGHSVETNTEGILTFIISHRFGKTNDDPNSLWGLDNAQMRMGLQYGVTNNLMIGLGRNSVDKTIDGFVKYKFLSQSTGAINMPVTMTLLGYCAIQPQLEDNPVVVYSLGQKLSYATQLIIGRKFSDRVSFQVMPTYLHRNLVAIDEENDVISVGAALQWQVIKNWSLITEYYHTPENMLVEGQYVPSLCFAFQIDTKGHVFQFNMGNSNGMTERIFLAESEGSWTGRDLYFGFNITRDFTIKGRKVR